jgi:hypothetical protein
MNLIGNWVVDGTDRRALADLGDVVLAFGEDNALIYTIRCRDKDQIIKLRYQIEGTTMVTDQPSAPRVERTEFSISENGVLTLAFNGVPYRFKRQLPER